MQAVTHVEEHGMMFSCSSNFSFRDRSAPVFFFVEAFAFRLAFVRECQSGRLVYRQMTFAGLWM
jgi:hypothetical protein